MIFQEERRIIAMIEKNSHFKVPPVESWSLIMRLLGRRYGFWAKLICGIILTLILMALAYFDLLTFEQVNLKPLAGLVVLVAFVIFRLNGIWWLAAVIFLYQAILAKHRLLPSAQDLAMDDVIVAVTFGATGLLMAWVAEGLLTLRRVHQELYRDLKLAGEVQGHILSLPLQLPWIAAEGLLRPIGEVGGDFYLLIPQGEQSLFFAIGDVQGKGVAAALTMAKVMAILTELSHSRQSLDRYLLEVNKRLFGADDSMVTACVGKIFLQNDGTLEFKFASAGHEAGFWIKQDEPSVKLEATGLPLGVLQEIEYSEQSVKLKPGDRLLFYTDGLTESRNAELQPFGSEQLFIQAVSLSKVPENNNLQPWLEQIMDEVEKYRGMKPREDDMALLGILLMKAPS